MPPATNQPADRDETSLDPDQLTRVRSSKSNALENDSVIAIRPTREGYLPEATDRAHFSGIEEVSILVDETRGLLVLDPVEDPDAYDDAELLSLGRSYDAGANVSLKSTFSALGVGPDDLPIDSSTHLDLEERDGYYVADLAEVLPDDVLDDQDDQAQDDETRTDGGTATRSSAERVDTPPVTEAYDLERLEDLAAESPSLREFAGRIDETVGRARVVAMDADVYDQLPDRPGAYRGGVGR